MAELYYGEHVLIPYPANWKTVPTLKLVHSSQVDETPRGEEGRASIWHAFRREQTYVISSLDGEQSGRMEETLRVALESKIVACPFWLAMRHIKSIAGPVCTLAHELALPVVAGQRLWWASEDRKNFGLVAVASGSGTSLTLSDLPDGFGAGGVIAPVLCGRINGKPNIKPTNGACRSYTITIRERGGSAILSRTVEDALTLSVGMSAINFTTMLTGENSVDNEVTALGFVGTMQRVVFIRSSDELAGSSALEMAGMMIQIAFERTGGDETFTTSVGFGGIMT
jgi:hypothetical protein